MENINLKINGMEISVPKGTTILEAAHMANIDIPTLCFLKLSLIHISEPTRP